MRMSNKLYDRIKWLIVFFLPAVGALYWGAIRIWDFPRVTGVNGTINAIIAILGLILQYSAKRYAQKHASPDGDLFVANMDGEKYLSLGVNGSVDSLTAKEVVRLRVVEQSIPS